MLEGDLFRLNDPTTSNFFCEQIVSKDKSTAHICAMRALSVPNGFCLRIYPRGLDADSLYYIEQLDLQLYGSTIMNAGIAIRFDKTDFNTKTLTVKRI